MRPNICIGLGHYVLGLSCHKLGLSLHGLSYHLYSEFEIFLSHIFGHMSNHSLISSKNSFIHILFYQSPRILPSSIHFVNTQENDQKMDFYRVKLYGTTQE